MTSLRMVVPRQRGVLLAFVLAASVGCSTSSSEPGAGGNGGSRGEVTPADPIPEPASGYPGFASPQVQSIALSPIAGEVYVTNTAADTLDIIDMETREIIYRVATGIDPVSVAVRPDGLEVWVANHVSDSVSIIDVNPTSTTRYRVIGTVQALDEEGMVTDFDEPSGIAFANNDKAYVAITSRNRIAVIDVATREVTKQIQVRAQEPRALTVRNGHLYVIPFESGNQTELSGCFVNSASQDCTFDIPGVLFANAHDAILTRNFVADIVRNPLVPDRDLFVYDTNDDSLVEEVSTIGTLLYGVAVDSRERVFIAQTEARNDANGRAGTEGDDLIDTENRAFLNQIARLECGDGCGALSLLELEPVPPDHPAPGMQLATPFGIQVSDDDSTIVAVAAGSSRLFTLDPDTGEVLGRLAVGAIPKSLSLQSAEDGSPETAWVYNAIENSVSAVDVSDPTSPAELGRVALADPTDPIVKRGRIAFNDAEGSTTGTFSCESCHPDGNVDQLLWNLGAICLTEGCNQTQPRVTMTVRGLRDTLPLHWDGVPGDPFGGINAEVADSGEVVEPNCTDEHSCFRNLVDGAMSGTMCNLDACPTDQNEKGLEGAFNEEDRDAMAVFLTTVPYPPTRSRRFDDALSDDAFTGFLNFTIGAEPERGGCNRVGVCHTAPFWAGTNTPGSGFDAPTFRGLYDRHLLLPNGRGGMWEYLRLSDINPVDHDPNDGPDELYSWAATFGTEEFPIVNRISFAYGPFEIFQFFEEGSTGFSGMVGKQVTLDAQSLSEGMADETSAVLDLLETAHGNGVVQLIGNGATLPDGQQVVIALRGAAYEQLDAEGGTSETFTREQLFEAAAAGELTMTITARLGVNTNAGIAQPGIWLPMVPPEISPTSNLQDFPRLADAPTTMNMFGRHIEPGAFLVIDGQRVESTVNCVAGELPDCVDEEIAIELADLPSAGRHTYQIVNPNGLTTNELHLTVE